MKTRDDKDEGVIHTIVQDVRKTLEKLGYVDGGLRKDVYFKK